jgi:proteasome lid subunit RPN8/RPN11
VLLFRDRSQLDALLEDALSCEGEERCGLILGEEGGDPGDPEALRRVLEVVAARNVHPEPSRSYEIDPEALFRVHRAAREGGPHLLGAWHSHPRGEAVPSRRDRELAWPGYAYLIVAPGPKCRCWRLAGDGFLEEEVEAGAG